MPFKSRSKKSSKKRIKKKNKSTKINVNNDVKTNGINPLYLEEIVEMLFCHLNYETLCKVQYVSRLWQKKAHEKFLKNYPPFCLNLPVLYCEDNKHLLHDQINCITENPMINNLLVTLPAKLAIIFTDGRFPEKFSRVEICTSDNLDNVADDYLKFLPCPSIAVYEFIYVDDINIDGKKNLMTALFFPIIPSIEIKSSIVIASNMNKFFDDDDVLIGLFDLEDPVEKEYCIIILGLHYKDCKPKKNARFIREFLNFLKLRSKTYKTTVWGGAHLEIRHADIEPDSEKIQWHIFNIIGINSYSIALSFDLNEKSFKKKLKDFKDKINLKKNSFALAITHTKESEKEELDQIMKKVLWFKDIINIKLTTTIAYVEDYSCDPLIFCSESDNADFIIENNNHNTVAYLIINT